MSASLPPLSRQRLSRQPEPARPTGARPALLRSAAPGAPGLLSPAPRASLPHRSPHPGPLPAPQLRSPGRSARRARTPGGVLGGGIARAARGPSPGADNGRAVPAGSPWRRNSSIIADRRRRSPLAPGRGSPRCAPPPPSPPRGAHPSPLGAARGRAGSGLSPPPGAHRGRIAPSPPAANPSPLHSHFSLTPFRALCRAPPPPPPPSAAQPPGEERADGGGGHAAPGGGSALFRGLRGPHRRRAGTRSSVCPSAPADSGAVTALGAPTAPPAPPPPLPPAPAPTTPSSIPYPGPSPRSLPQLRGAGQGRAGQDPLPVPPPPAPPRSPFVSHRPRTYPGWIGP